MQLSFRLAQLLEQYGDHHRGIIKRICKHTNLERHQVAALLHNRTQYLSLATLAAVCDYLVEHHQIDPQQLPGLLFAREPEDFWALLAGRRQLHVCLGVRRMNEWPEMAWVTDSDAYLQGTLVHGISGLVDDTEQASPRPRPQFLEQHLLPAPGPLVGADFAQRAAAALYGDFAGHGGDRALVGLGSVKINTVVELILAHAFGAEPFHSEDKVPRPQVRRCPFLFRYRAQDPQPASCCGGVRLARSKEAPHPGIWYEEVDGKWGCCLWDEHTHDAALVFYIYRPPLGRLELVLAGFSSRATRCLADCLRSHAAMFWPPPFATPELQVGAYVVRFRFEPNGESSAPVHRDPAKTEVVPLAAEVLERRLAK